MLKLTDIKKTYDLGGQNVEALRSVSLSFRKNEFVAVLGPSGCVEHSHVSESGDMGIFFPKS